MDKQRYIEYAKRELIVENLETIYECEERAVYVATTLKYGDIIMKMNDDVYELMMEYTALKDMSGNNCAKVYNCIGGEMILEERIIPGNELRKVVDTDTRLSYFVETFNCIHKIPMNAKMYDTYLDWLSRAYEFCIGANVKPELTEKMHVAKAIGEELFEKYPERVLLHGDLHHDNMLLNKEGKYSIIDPKGVIGPEVFDIPRFVLNELDEDVNIKGKEHISYVISELSKRLSYDITDIKKLFFMETILSNAWCVEDGEEVDEEAIGIAAEILREV